MRHREPAICLRTTDFSETSQVLHFLTRGQGVVHVLGKGTKRPKSKSGGAIDLMCEGEVVLHGRVRVGLRENGSEDSGSLRSTRKHKHTFLRPDDQRCKMGRYRLGS